MAGDTIHVFSGKWLEESCYLMETEVVMQVAITVKVNGKRVKKALLLKTSFWPTV